MPDAFLRRLKLEDWSRESCGFMNHMREGVPMGRLKWQHGGKVELKRYGKSSQWYPRKSPHFLLRCNLIFVPTSVSDADVHATKKYLQSLRDLFDRQNQQLSEVGSPAIVILPNMMDSRDEYNELRQMLADEPVYYGEPLYFSTVFRRAFRDEENDRNVKRLMLDSAEYVNWITSLILNSEELNGAEAKLFQL